MHTVIETPAFLASSADEAVDEEEREAIISFIAKHPYAGDVMQGPAVRERFAFADGQR